MGYRVLTMNMLHKQGIFEEKAKEYWKAEKREKSLILDAMVKVSGLSRKRAIRRFHIMQTRDPCHDEQRGRPRYFTPDVIAALKDVWKIGSEACGENLHSQISGYIDTQIKASDWKHDDSTTGKLRVMSLGSVKKYVGQFERRRLFFGGKSTTQRSSVISMVPIRMDGWETAETGVTQIDTVAHCGDSVAGDYVFTTNGTDVATMWGSRRAQWCKGQEATKDSLVEMRSNSPYPWTEIHPDSGKEFINAHCFAYAKDTNLRMTRSRPYHKDDNCFVEERNGHVVRTYVGFSRFDVPQVVKALNDLYDVLTPYLNHFIASRRIVSKERVGARWKVTREKVSKTPYQRVLERSDVTETVKERLQAEHEKLNPKKMKLEIDRLTKRVHDTQRRYGILRKLSKTVR
jgi:hypothetical protein